MIASTSIAAYHSIEVTNLEQKVLDAIDGHGGFGCISDEVRGAYPEMSYSSVTARFSSLENKGLISCGPDTRLGVSNRQQRVMRSWRFSHTVPASLPAEKEKLSAFSKGQIYAAKYLANILTSYSDFDEAKHEFGNAVRRMLTK